MSKYKVCFWMNTKSNHQNAFFEELYKNEQIDLQIRYISQPSQNRIDIGWDNSVLESYEFYVYTFEKAINSLNDFDERIHIVLGNKITYSQKLIDLFISNNLKWIHWSERYGVNLAKKLNYNLTLFHLLKPIFLLTKFSYFKLVKNYALGCFAQGKLAKNDFKFLGINNEKINDLFYTVSNEKEIIKKDTKRVLTFLYIGTVSKGKGINDLLYACSKLKNITNWKLLVVGSNPRKDYYHNISKNLGLTQNIEYIGVVQNKDIYEYYQKSDVFILPSRYDGWGAVINEAISVGLPVISSSETGASYSLVKNNGFVFKAGDINALSDAMKKYINNKELIIEHSKNSKELSKICTPKANVERFINALNNWTNNDI